MLESGISEMPVADIMQRWPQTIRVFLDWHLHCVGCPIARFHTLADSAREHGYELGDLEAAILAAIAMPSPAMSSGIDAERLRP